MTLERFTWKLALIWASFRMSADIARRVGELIALGIALYLIA